MLKWNIGANGSCVFCQNNIETRNHLYFACKFSEEICGSLVRKLLTSKYTVVWDREFSCFSYDTCSK